MRRWVAIAMLLTAVTAAAADKGWFGFSLTVDTEGLSLNPTLRSITILKVVTPSPAASAGLMPEDAVVEVEGIKVAGAKADSLKEAMQKTTGQTLHLKIQRGGAEPREVSLIAVSKPTGQP